jgi:hypothetical protein
MTTCWTCLRCWSLSRTPRRRCSWCWRWPLGESCSTGVGPPCLPISAMVLAMSTSPFSTLRLSLVPALCRHVWVTLHPWVAPVTLPLFPRRIKIDEGTDEAFARVYLRQLLAGVAFCHLHGVCHRTCDWYCCRCGCCPLAPLSPCPLVPLSPCPLASCPPNGKYHPLAPPRSLRLV